MLGLARKVLDEYKALNLLTTVASTIQEWGGGNWRAYLKSVLTKHNHTVIQIHNIVPWE